jgi:hypothetical protein
MEETWLSRDLPVLDAIVSQIDKVAGGAGWPDVEDIAGVTGLDIQDIAIAMNALDGDFITLIRAGTITGWHVTKVTMAARQIVGQWPNPAALVDQLIEAFGDAAEREPDTEQKGRFRQIASFLGSTGRDVATEVVSKVVLHSVGM